MTDKYPWPSHRGREGEGHHPEEHGGRQAGGGGGADHQQDAQNR